MKNKLQSCETGFAKIDLKKPFPFSSLWYRVFLHDVTAAILVSQNNETEAMLVFQTNPLRVKLLSYANVLFCSNTFA